MCLRRAWKMGTFSIENHVIQNSNDHPTSLITLPNAKGRSVDLPAICEYEKSIWDQ